MGILEGSNRYALDNFEGEGFQEIQFIEKEARPDGTFATIKNGTTNEEVLLMLIDRLGKLNVKMPCRENSLAITKLEEALMWLNRRTAARKERGVENTAQA